MQRITIATTTSIFLYYHLCRSSQWFWFSLVSNIVLHSMFWFDV